MNSKVEDTYFQRKHSIRTGDKLLDLSTPVVMGILNTTPDSFYGSSRVSTEKEVLERAEKMLDQGAAILDMGGYSSRPGAIDISIQEEFDRVVPLIGQVKKHFPESIISIDTFRAQIADAAIGEGASIINDISGFSIDPKIADIAGKNGVPYVLMHMRGTPQTMTKLTNYDNIFVDIYSYFSEKITQLKMKGVKDIILDPGFGFSKTMEQNHELMSNLEYFNQLGHPILVGISRKGMIYKKLGIKPEEALQGTIALNAIALSKGANILRVHDVKEAADLIRLLF